MPKICFLLAAEDHRRIYMSNLTETRQKLSDAIAQKMRLEQKLIEIRHRMIFAQRRIAMAMRSSNEISALRTRALLRDRGTTAPQGELERLKTEETEISRNLEEAKSRLKDLVSAFGAIHPTETTKLMSSDLPIVLFPARIETKFQTSNQTGNSQLLVRIYPDQIAIQTHENGLTQDEIDSGKSYWKKVWYAGKSEIETRKNEWGVLSARYGSYRAAWIVRSLEKVLKNKEQWPINKTSPDSGTPAPEFGDLDPKPASWTLPPATYVMPDRWVAITYSGGKETHRAVGNPIQPKLNVGINPMFSKETDIGGEGELRIDDDMKWMFDFNTAEKEGMGIRIDLTPEEARNGFTRIIVVGLKYSADGDRSAKLLEDLFESHHYTQSMSFIAQGTPTNNTEEKRSGFSSKENYQNSFEIELSDPLYVPADDPNKAKDGELVARAFGLNPAFFAHVENSGLSEQRDARHMGTALWPSTMGYFLEEMMNPVFNIEDIRKARRFFISNVLARGPLPAFRVGKTPYGILPVSSLKKWKSSTEDGKIESVLPGFLRILLPIWEENIGGVPHVGPSNDPDGDLLNILGMDASSYEFKARDSIGEEYVRNLFNLFPRFTAKERWKQHRILAKDILNRIGHPEWEPRLLKMTFGGDYDLLIDTVQQGSLSETDPLSSDSNYIHWLSTATIEEIRQREQLYSDKPNSLLYMLLRHSMLREYVRTSLKVLSKREMIPLARTREPELIGMRTSNEPHTVYSGLDKTVPDLSRQKLGVYLQGVTQANASVDQGLEELAALKESFAHLEGVPTAKLERLMSETLDVFSHRLDAWMTSLYTERLYKKRYARPSDERKARLSGVYMGGYGWLENVKPSKAKQLAEQVNLPEHTKPAIVLNELGIAKQLPRPVVSPDNAGFIHAPSLSHAAAAAVLRNAYLTHTSDVEPFKINLSSERVRRSIWFLDGIRGGQPLAALLGYRFERGLHENHPGLELDQYIQPLRDLFLLDPTTKASESDSQESVQPRNVVNGLSMLKEWRNDKFSSVFQKLNISDQEHRDAIAKELEALEDIVDGISDLTLTEAVFQMIQGNHIGMAANLDAYARGERPPEPQVIRTPRSGVRLTHRIMLLFFGDQTLASRWNGSKDNPRAKAEPNLNAWLARALGDPSKIICKVKYKKNGSSFNEEVTLARLKICPLDFLELSVATPEPQKGELDARVAYLILSDDPERKDLEITYAVERTKLGDGKMSFADALEFARRLRKFVSNARETMPEHIVLPEETSAAGQVIIADLRDRAISARNELQSAIDDLNTAASSSSPSENDLAKALLKASLFGVPGAVPDPPTGNTAEYLDALKKLALSVKDELSKRLKAADDPKLQFNTNDSINDQIQEAFSLVRSIFGLSFKILPQFRTSNPTELSNSLGNADTLLANDKDVPIRWFQQAAKVRPMLSLYEDAIAFAEALHNDTLRFNVVQLPFESTERWVALPFDKDNKPSNGKLSLVFTPYGNPDFATNLSGLTIDDWTEVIPSGEETTGVAFHYDGPNSEAPQAVLLAVSPGSGPTWELEAIIDIVYETLDLAKIRAIDRDLLGMFGQFLPALFFTANVKGQAINTDFAMANQIKIQFEGGTVN